MIKFKLTVSQVFLSYRHVPPDEQLAQGLCAFLEKRGLRVFLDNQILVGSDWVREIDRQLRASDSFVVFLSEESIRSDMVRQEVKTAHKLLEAGKMAMFPVRLGFEGELPYDLASYLNRIQYALWKPGDPETELFALLHRAITSGTSLPVDPPSEDTVVISLRDPSVAAEWRGAPLPAADPRIVMETGTIRLNSPFYIRRREDDYVERCLAQSGHTIMIWGPGQTGKSSLLARAYALSQQKDFRSVFLDFQDFDEGQVASLSTILRTLAHKIARALRTTVQPAEVWDSDFLGEKGSFEEFLQAAVFSEPAAPFVLILDQVDRVFDRPYREDFFAAMRGWHNNRATKETWSDFHLVLGHATDPGLWIESLNASPFNIGDRLRLRDFTPDQVTELNARHGYPLRNAEIADLMALIGGHPYLIRQALFVLAVERWSLAHLKEEAGKDTGPFGDHLRRHLWALIGNDHLRAMVSRIARGGDCNDEGLYQRLLGLGLIDGETRFGARLRCTLYQEYFSRRL